MPVPVWDSSDIGLLGEPLDTVLSDDIWKKFDLEAPLPMYSHCNYERTYEENMISEQCGKENYLDYQEIRHHDCMWAGLCISKEHSRTMPTKKDCQMHRKVPAGRSLLISRATSSSSQQQQHNNKQKQHNRTDNLESDGDSTRSETPQALSESDSESDCDVPMFKHDQISINDKLSEWMTMATKAAPVSEVTGQFVRSNHLRRKLNVSNETTHCKSSGNRTNVSINVAKENEIRNTTMSDHCYHINQPSMTRLTDLGVQTPSDSEEEIDVVSFEKPCRPAALPTHPNSVDHQAFQLTVNTALKEKPTPRPRGRPPSNANRKRAAQENNQRPAKRMATQRTCQKKTKVMKNTPLSPPTPAPVAVPTVSVTPSVQKSTPLVKPCFDDEPDNDKRNLHNNMERQRRIELRHAFDDLRRLVPEIEAKEKAPKVAILQQAAEYCERLKQNFDENVITEAAEIKRQKKLMAKIQHLRLTLAKMRREKYFVENFKYSEAAN